VVTCPVFASYQRRFSPPVDKLSWTARFRERSTGSINPALTKAYESAVVVAYDDSGI